MEDKATQPENRTVMLVWPFLLLGIVYFHFSILGGRGDAFLISLIPAVAVGLVMIVSNLGYLIRKPHVGLLNAVGLGGFFLPLHKISQGHWDHFMPALFGFLTGVVPVSLMVYFAILCFQGTRKA